MEEKNFDVLCNELKEKYPNLNITEFFNLIKRYESITLEEIDKISFGLTPFSTANKLTGYGYGHTCKLCKYFEKERGTTKCWDCVYTQFTEFKCFEGSNAFTYLNINLAENSKELLEAFRDRANHMREIIVEFSKIKEQIKL